MAGARRPARALLRLGVMLVCCVPQSRQQGTGKGGYTGYDGFWVWDEEQDARLGGFGRQDVAVRLVDAVSPCKFDGRICTRSKDVLSNPGEFVHNTGRTFCTKRTTVLDCDTRMRDRGLAQRLDAFRPQPLELYPQVDGHTTSTFVSGTNFYGELGLGTRIAVHKPTIQTYFKLGDGLYDQPMGAGRGFKNVSLINFGFAHGFALDSQGVFYAWGTNEFGQLGIQTRDHPTGHRYHSLFPQPLPFFRPFRIPMCEGGINNLRFCQGPDDVSTCFPRSSAACVLGANPVSPRRNAFGASKQPSQVAHSAVVTDFYPHHCFSYKDFLDEDVTKNGFDDCIDGGKLYTWGYNIKGQLGTGVATTYAKLPKPVPVPDDPNDRWYSVALGGQHTVASTISGRVFTWGLNDEGQLGFDSNYMKERCSGPVATGVCCNGFCNIPQLVIGACNSLDDCLDGVKIVHVGAGLDFTVLLDVQGNVWAFGSNAYGQLCQGTRVQAFGAPPVANFDDLLSPKKASLPSDVRIADVIVGYYHVLAVSTGGYLFAWGRNDRGQLGRGHTVHDSCHLEVRTELPAPLDMECKGARINGSKMLHRLNLCNIVPGNLTTAAAGELHSGAITRANFTWRDPKRGVAGAKYAATYVGDPNGGPPKFDEPYKYPGNELDFPKPISYEPSKMFLDCTGPYRDQCKEQGLLHRWPNRLAHVYMFGDNRLGQLGISEKEAYYATPQLQRDFLAYDWGGIAAGSRQTFWTSRANVCSGNCNGHGICDHDTGRCTCEEPWTYELDCLTAYCPNNCSGNGACFPRKDAGDTGLNKAFHSDGPECSCHYPFWDIDCSRAQCPNNCWGPDHGICNTTDGTCVCVGNATVTYTGFDCYVPDPLHVLDPLRFYTQQLLRISPFFVNGSAANLSKAQQDLLDLVAKYGDSDDALNAEKQQKIGKTNAELAGTDEKAIEAQKQAEVRQQTAEAQATGGKDRRGVGHAARAHASGYVARTLLAFLSILVVFFIWK